MFDRIRSKAQWLSLPAVLLFAGFATPLHASQDRIRASVAASSLTELPQNVAPRARAAADLGAADPKLVLDNITLSFSITDAQQAALTELLLEQQQPTSANYHKWLTPEQFADQFGLSTTDLAKVTTWLTSQGFTVTSVPRSRNFVSFSGTAAQVQQAFGTTIHNLSLNGEKHFANLSDPSVPSALAGVVGSISGLHDFKLTSRARSRTVSLPAADAVHTQFTSNLTGNIYVAPSDFYTIYDENSLLSGGTNGSGVTIAVMGQTDISLSDVAAFRSAAGLSANAPTVKLYGTDPGVPSANDLIEGQLDVEWAGATAPAASIIYVNSTNVIDISLRQAIANNLAPIITISYGNCETGYGGAATLASFNLAFQQANAQGITIVGPAGDSGAADCDYQSTSATQGLAVDFPASSPYVTAVGGTMFNDSTSTSTYWATTNSSAYNGSESALSYIPEAVWNESSSSGLAAGGGGVSIYFTKPAWQVGTGVPADFSRDVPDVSLNAAAGHEPTLICSSGSCVNGFRTASTTSCPGGCLNVIGGTSVATPEFAGLLALIEQKTGSRIGNANPTLYALANSTYYASVFHDITTGNNAVPCTSGSPNCPAGVTTIGYSAGVGYDTATGWGTVDAYNLVNDWKLVTPIGTGTGVGQVLSTTTVTTSTPNVTQGTAITFTATVASGNTSTTNGAPSSSATPTGTVQLFVDGTASGSTVALVSGSATLTLATTSITAGTHTVSVAYSGDANYAGSKGSVGIDVTSAASADFSIAASATTITVKSGAAAPTVTYTLKSLNNFAGTVTMSASSATSLTASANFTPSSVTLTAGSSGTSVFALYAYVTNGSSTPALPLASNRKPTWMLASGGMAFASMLLILIPRRKRRKLSRNAGLFCVLLLSVVALGLSGCGGSSGLSSVAGSQTNTTPGTYPITITATSGSVTHTTTLTLVVQ